MKSSKLIAWLNTRIEICEQMAGAYECSGVGDPQLERDSKVERAAYMRMLNHLRELQGYGPLL